mmetsp:Transcript_42927/g.96457  ORF Transcript_42927/g.96457 Transcript_42927/m.96457 type:complete len:563 (+) Transcript_42927:54-1742(+)
MAPTMEDTGWDAAWAVEELHMAMMSESEGEILAAVDYISKADPDDAFAYGYGELLAGVMTHRSADVCVEALRALAKLPTAAHDVAFKLPTLLSHKSANVRAAAAKALGAAGAVEYGSALLKCIEEDGDDAVCAAAVLALAQSGHDRHAKRISELLSSGSSLKVGAACVALARLPSAEEYCDAIAAKLSSPSTSHSSVVALGCMTPTAAGAHIKAIVEHGLASLDARTREAAIETVGKAGGADAGQKVADLLSNEEAGVRCAAALALAQLQAVEQADMLLPLLNDTQEDSNWKSGQMGGGGARPRPELRRPRCAALVSLGTLKVEAARAAIEEFCSDEDWELRCCACTALAQLGPQDQTEAKLEVLLQDKLFAVRAAACEALRSMRASSKADIVAGLLEDKSPSVRYAAVSTLGTFGEDSSIATEGIFKLIDDNQPRIRAAALTALPSVGEAAYGYAGTICACLYDPQACVRSAAVEALGNMGQRGAAFAEDVAASLHDFAPKVRLAAARSLGKMGEDAAPYMDDLRAIEVGDDAELAEVIADALAKLRIWAPWVMIAAPEGE